MNRDELTKRLRGLGMDKKRFGEMVGVSHQTILKWKETPKWVDVLICEMEEREKLKKALEVLRGEVISQS